MGMNFDLHPRTLIASIKAQKLGKRRMSPRTAKRVIRLLDWRRKLFRWTSTDLNRSAEHLSRRIQEVLSKSGVG
jgi:hypothetical protein